MHNNLPKKYYFIESFNKSNIDRHDFFLSNNVKLSIKLGLDGVYLPSFNNEIRHLNYKYKKKFLIIGSAHNLKEIKIKEFQKAELIFISSIFKKNKNYLGINKFRNISRHCNKKIIALGGVSQKNLKFLNLTDCYGFAGISYFK